MFVTLRVTESPWQNWVGPLAEIYVEAGVGLMVTLVWLDVTVQLARVLIAFTEYAPEIDFTI